MPCKAIGDSQNLPKGAVVSDESFLLVAETEEGEPLEGVAEKRRRYVRKVACAVWLQRHMLIAKEAMHREHPGSVHIALDAAKAGGKEAQLGVAYHTHAKAACWVPPQGCWLEVTG